VQLLKLHDGSIRQVSETVGVLQKSVADLVQELRLQRGGGGSSGVGGGCCVAWVRILAFILQRALCFFLPPMRASRHCQQAVEPEPALEWLVTARRCL
jgi:hypothetical protein